MVMMMEVQLISKVKNIIVATVYIGVHIQFILVP